MKSLRAVAMTLLVFALAVPSAALADSRTDLVQQIGEGSINWGSGIVRCTGVGAPPEKFYGKPNARPLAIRAAKVVAMRNILETLQGVRVDSVTVVKDLAVESDVIRTQVEGMVRGAQQVKVEYMSDGTVEVTMEVNMRGEFTQLVLPQNITPTQGESSQEAKPMTGSNIYTGLVVDATGLNARPAMAPKVVDEDGAEVYGSAFVSREYAVQQGMSGYAKDLSNAKSNQRVTSNPLVVKGLRTDGPGQCDIVISNADAAKLRAEAENLSFLEKCRVMIVVD